ncbi:MAG: bifunctional serine/threonine-protein kinase/formylglycine-generating enzyme family protein [Pseudomonadota bacterium]|nr:bifunctional serine/threonine-protein kinase/formylglycine-generating enzyme family protein [Pseudomonadota bacterium]
MLTPGTLLESRYEVLDLVGSGTFARVYRVRHTGLRSLHALKVLDEHFAQLADVRARFLAEGRIQAQLRHPNLVAATDVLTTPVSGLVMDLVEGPSLRAHLAALGRRMTLAEALDVLLPVLEAVGVAHRAGIVHRDLKPENVLLARDARGDLHPMVTDFGIAKVIAGSTLAMGRQRTDAGLRVGTLHYMSPEQVRGSDDVGPETDIWAIGVLLYELLTGHLPFEADSEYDTMRDIVSGSYHAPETHVPDLSPAVGAILRRALALSPAARFPTCEALRSALAATDERELADDDVTDPGGLIPPWLAVSAPPSAPAPPHDPTPSTWHGAIAEAVLVEEPTDEPVRPFRGSRAPENRAPESPRSAQAAHPAAAPSPAPLPSGARSTKPPPAPPPATAAPVTPPLATPPAGRPTRSVMLVAGVVGLAVVGVIALSVQRTSSEKAAEAPPPAPVTGAPVTGAPATGAPATGAPVTGAAASAPLPERYPMVALSPRRFTMGAPAAEAERWKDETPHPVELTRPLLVGIHEVNQALWTEVMGDNPSAHLSPERPVEGITWNEAVDFCNRLSTREGLVPAYVVGPSVLLRPDADGYRLPTEAEWEAAARADAAGGSAPDAYAGSAQVGEVAWFDATSGGTTHPVGTLRPNGLGLHDMSGNVSEWAWDLYGDYPTGLATDPTGAEDGEPRIHRGGSWNAGARAQRVAYRRAALPGTRSQGIGLRLVRTVTVSSATPPGRRPR